MFWVDTAAVRIWQARFGHRHLESRFEPFSSSGHLLIFSRTNIWAVVHSAHADLVKLRTSQNFWVQEWMSAVRFEAGTTCFSNENLL